MPTECRNCGRPAGPRFCGHCGQELEDRRQPLVPLVRELASEWFSLDGRLVRSLGALARPGLLTCHYLDGKRAAYVRPLRLYMVASLVLFSSVLALRAPDASEVDFFVAGVRVTAAPDIPERPNLSILAPDSNVLWWMAGRLTDRVERLREVPPQDLLDSLFADLRRVLPASLILFLPFLALALKLLYLRGATLYVDHVVFAVHFQCALFLALALAWLLARAVGLGDLPRVLTYVVVGFLVMVVYLPVALRRVYRQPRWLTGVKTLLLIVCYAQLLKFVASIPMLFLILRL